MRDQDSAEAPAARRRPGRPSETFPPEMRSMKLENWPAPDQDAWAKAIMQPADIFDEPGAAAHLRATSQANRVAAWGQFLNFLELRGELERDAPPESRPTEARVGAWIASLRQRQTANTVQRMLVEMSFVIAAMVPGQDWGWIRRHRARPTPAQIKAERRPIQAFDAALLVKGIRERLAVLEAGVHDRLTAREARDLTIVLLATYTGLRSANLCNLRIGQQFRIIEGGYAISLEQEETKTGVAFEVMVEAVPAAALAVYLKLWRPILRGNNPDENWLWLRHGGLPIASEAMYQVFQRVGRRVLGRAIRPHLVRHSIATGLLMENPSAIGIAAAALGHAGSRSVSEVYDRSGAAGAHQRWAEVTASVLEAER